jgi:hypothetical protein
MLEGKLPLCAEMCSTKSLLAGDGEMIAQIYKDRALQRGYGSGAWGWTTPITKECRCEPPARREPVERIAKEAPAATWQPRSRAPSVGRAPRSLTAALKEAAARELTTGSEYVQRALVER